MKKLIAIILVGALAGRGLTFIIQRKKKGKKSSKQAELQEKEVLPQVGFKST